MSSTRTKPLFTLAAAALIALACGDGPTDPDRGNPGPKPVATVTILPETRALVVGDTLALSARALAADGSVVTGRAVEWTTTDGAVLELIPNARVVAKAPGSATVRATVEGKVGEAAMTIQVAPVSQVELSAAALSLELGDSQTLTATARDAKGRVLEGRAASWRSEDAAVATVDAAGHVAGHAEGQTAIVVEIEGKSARAAVTVTKAAVATVVIAPAAMLIQIGQAVQFAARLYDARGNELTGRDVVWSTDAPTVTPINAAGRIWAASPGYATIFATSEGKKSGVAVTVANGEADPMPYDLLYHRVTSDAWGEIMILGSAGESAPVRVNAGNVSRQGTASPDGQRIAFHVSMQELGTGKMIHDLFAVDRNGMNMKRLTSEDGYEDEPSWSPAGDRIAYRQIDPSGATSAIWVMDADGSNKVKLTGDLEGTYGVGWPSWSPDGSRIAFATVGAFGTTSGIWSMRADGSDKRQHAASDNGYDDMPSWSPAGDRIVFTRSYAGDRDLTIVTLAGGATQRIALAGNQWKPAWSPDGRHIAFWQPVGNTGGNGIYTVRADGTNVRMHTTVASWGGGSDPSWIRR